ncbi:hypothetical protein BC835DRAFT_333690 [Cytidiella melzeri]|nr:hypothetical protein BC835DRAFT_333690 [Cytidiella melzeri]
MSCEDTENASARMIRIFSQPWPSQNSFSVERGEVAGPMFPVDWPRRVRESLGLDWGRTIWRLLAEGSAN